MVVESGQVQWRLVLIAVGVNVCFILKEVARRLKVPYVSAVVECGPAVCVNCVYIALAVINNGYQSLVLLVLVGKYCFVDWCLVENALTIVNFVAAIHQVLNVFLVSLPSCLVQILDHISRKFVFTHVQGAMRLSKSG